MAGKNLPHSDSVRFAPLYHQSRVNENILFDEFIATILEKSAETSEDVLIKCKLSFLPDDELLISVPLKSESPFPFVGISKKLRLVLPDPSGSMDLFYNRTEGSFTLHTPSQLPIEIRTSEKLTTVSFHIFNWPDFVGNDDYALVTETSVSRLGGMKLDFGDWIVEIAATDKTRALVEELRESGGFAITHVGKITRVDHSEFTIDDLAVVQNFLKYLLSFCSGKWCNPSLYVGLNSNSKVVYKTIGLAFVDKDSWDGNRSWVDKHHFSAIAEVAPLLFNMWNKPVWRSELTKVIYWYIQANRGGSTLPVDAALLMSQVCLERLAYTVCVIDRKTKTHSEFKVKASDKFRMLVEELQIPSGIPDSKTFEDLSNCKSWDDALHAITFIRNSLVHPGSEEGLPGLSCYNAWLLSMWFNEIVLLKACGYKGRYSNRLADRWVGETELIP